jgi:RNA polymerase sigma-70 factor (ECF subfamily)
MAALEEATLVSRLRARDEAAFATLVDRHGASLLRLAQTFVGSRAVAEEVVQETWLAVLRGIDGFESRSSLKTWIYRILVNRARTRAVREARVIPFAALARDDEPAVEPEAFLAPGNWAVLPRRWESQPEDRVVGDETLAVIRVAIESLPPSQREVITLRDVEGWTSDEVRNVLDLSESNQRVLLHRARSKVRRALDAYLTE